MQPAARLRFRAADRPAAVHFLRKWTVAGVPLHPSRIRGRHRTRALMVLNFRRKLATAGDAVGRPDYGFPKRRWKRWARCSAYHARRAGLLLKRRFRFPSGMAEPPQHRIRQQKSNPALRSRRPLSPKVGRCERKPSSVQTLVRHPARPPTAANFRRKLGTAVLDFLRNSKHDGRKSKRRT